MDSKTIMFTEKGVDWCLLQAEGLGEGGDIGERMQNFNLVVYIF